MTKQVAVVTKAQNEEASRWWVAVEHRPATSAVVDGADSLGLRRLCSAGSLVKGGNCGGCVALSWCSLCWRFAVWVADVEVWCL